MTLLISMPGGTEWILILLAFGLLQIIPIIFYLITLQSTLSTISIENRKMPSGNVWLLLIPLFGTVWHFIVVNKLASSIKAEGDSLSIKLEEQKPGYNIGLAMCILNCLFIIPGVNVLTSIAGLVCWIIYWVKISSYKNILLMGRYNTIGTNS
ncbi:MAG: hypothetical protein QM802_02545 [Agriterribacter sp.]